MLAGSWRRASSCGTAPEGDDRKKMGRNAAALGRPLPTTHHSGPTDTEKSSPKCRNLLGVIPPNEWAGWLAGWLDRKERVSIAPASGDSVT